MEDIILSIASILIGVGGGFVAAKKRAQTQPPPEPADPAITGLTGLAGLVNPNIPHKHIWYSFKDEGEYRVYVCKCGDRLVRSRGVK